MPDGWVLAASSFNWTPEVIRAQRSAHDLVVGIAADGVAEVIEVEAGQVWRGFPTPTDVETDVLRDALTSAGARVSVLGASIDDYTSTGSRRTDDERLAFLLPQLKAAHRLGADGIRLPIGQAGRPLLERLQPLLHELELILFEEIQGQQSPQNPQTAEAIETIADFADPRLRLICDTSMLMPSLPPTYLEQLRRGGVADDLVDQLTHSWRDPATLDAVRAALSSNAVPPATHTLFMNLLIRFGRSDVDDLRDVVGLIGGFHLKFWDLDDGDDRVSGPIRALGRMLAGTEFRGTFTSEWGGHEWLDDLKPTEATRRHLALARAALADGVALER
ncbi:hypothetical protein [Kribbella sp. NPDC004536]|uniref:hypothetical protein n=1 Tax=Kribbella sp. NPDC004536 TaxID=3364106 RepID=UPI0036A5C90F